MDCGGGRRSRVCQVLGARAVVAGGCSMDRGIGPSTSDAVRLPEHGPVDDSMDSVMGVDPSASVAGLADSRAAGRPRWYGRRVGRYRLLAELGKGSAGKVFEAEDV